MKPRLMQTLWLLIVMAIITACGVPTPVPREAMVIDRAAVIEATPMPADFVLKAPEENPKRGGILKTAWGMSPTHFDIHQGGGCAGCAMMYNGLIMWNLIDGYRSIIPALATTWTVSDDKTC